MTQNYFREGGPFEARRVDDGHMTFKMSIQTDAHGRIARQCPDEKCAPGYFRVFVDQSSVISHDDDGEAFVFCPYCGQKNDPGAFWTQQQVQHARDVAMHEVAVAFQNMMKQTLGGSKHVTYRPGSLRLPNRPFEDEVQRSVKCPHCQLDHAVFGVASWCPECGTDIFMTHVEAEYSVVLTMLSDIERRRESLGSRVAARDLENCLEDTVSIFEAVLKTFVRRFLRQQGKTDDEIEEVLQKKIRNGFQSIDRGEDLAKEYLGAGMLGTLQSNEIGQLRSVFEKRHPIAHNLGVVDRKYIERALAEEQEGRDVLVTEHEIRSACELCLRALSAVHGSLWAENDAPNQGSGE